MTSNSVEGMQFKERIWYKICHELLSIADIRINGARPFDITVKNDGFYKRVIQEGSLGLGESYMDGWWECEQLDEFFYRVTSAGLRNRLPRNVRDILRIAALQLVNLQSPQRAWIVGKKHYDLGNDLFSLMLDPYMQYSCAYWKDAKLLDEAQEAKLRLICEKLQLKPGMQLLDIGCGWGGLSEYAARHYGVTVVGVTISAEQQKLAQARCVGLDVTILLQDYRDLNGQFDRIVSVGMFEHVGHKNYTAYFSVVQRNIKPDGLFLLHTIGSNKTNRPLEPWTSKYIFPNGSLPSAKQIAQSSEGLFVMEDWHNFGADYDLTLKAWSERFRYAWSEIEGNYSERFYRMFTYYLNSCAGAFRSRDIQLWQVVFSPTGVKGGFRSLR